MKLMSLPKKSFLKTNKRDTPKESEMRPFLTRTVVTRHRIAVVARGWKHNASDAESPPINASKSLQGRRAEASGQVKATASVF